MSKISRVVSFFISIALLGGVVWLAFNRQTALDHLRVWQYQPTSDIERLATRAHLSERGRFQFFVTHPRLESSAEFNSECRRSEKGSPVLGCYKQGEDTIHIYNVTDPELDGIKEVTAAHEMLHAAYARLSQEEKQRLGRLLDAAYERVKDTKLEERMSYYERAQPGSQHNELHSILGTEYTDLGPELEAHYAIFFRDRSHIVAHHDRYSQKFIAIEQQVTALQQKLDAQRQAIERQKSIYDSGISALNRNITEFNQRAGSGGFRSQEEFAAQRSALQSEGRRLEAMRGAVLQLIEQYNADVERLNALGAQAERLNQSLDSQRAVQ